MIAVVVVGTVYAWFAQASNPTFGWGSERLGYYNYLARAFASGHLYLPIEPAPELLALPDPWDPERNQQYRVQDLALYSKRYYLYHGATPALLLFTPWLLVTQQDLPEPSAALIFAILGYACSCGILMRLLSWMKARPSLPWFTALLFALGLCQSMPYLLQRVRVYEVAIAGGYFCVSAGFWLLTTAVLAVKTRLVLLTLAGTMFGLAIGCRPHFAATAFIAACMLMLFREFRGRSVFVFSLPIAVCSFTIGVYNFVRFHDPVEFGMRYEMASAEYFRPALSLRNVVPGLYYLLACPPSISPVFPFVRLAARAPFDSPSYPVPKRYFAEPIAGAVPTWPLTLLALAAPVFIRGSKDRRLRALLGSLLVCAAVSILFIAALGLISHRFELDFLPWLVLAGCVPLGSARGVRFVRWVGGAAIVYSVAANLALGIQGPFDNFLQARPEAYVSMARWFSPVPRFRPLYNPRVTIDAEYTLPGDDVARSFPLIAAGHFGSRYLLAAEMSGGGRVRIISAGSPTSGQEVTAQVIATGGGPNRVRLDFDPVSRTMLVRWNGEIVLRHTLPFLVTAPSQVTVGEDRAEIDPRPARFPGSVVVMSKIVE